MEAGDRSSGRSSRRDSRNPAISADCYGGCRRIAGSIMRDYRSLVIDATHRRASSASTAIFGYRRRKGGPRHAGRPASSSGDLAADARSRCRRCRASAIQRKGRMAERGLRTARQAPIAVLVQHPDHAFGLLPGRTICGAETAAVRSGTQTSSPSPDRCVRRPKPSIAVRAPANASKLPAPTSLIEHVGKSPSASSTLHQIVKAMIRLLTWRTHRSSALSRRHNRGVKTDTASCVNGPASACGPEFALSLGEEIGAIAPFTE